jgi:hypothetical protein
MPNWAVQVGERRRTEIARICHYSAHRILEFVRAYDSEPKQKAQPRGANKAGVPHEPIEIPVPEKKEVLRILKKSAHPVEKDTD